MTVIATLADLETLYQPAPAPTSIVKQTSHITSHYRALIEASPFAVLATSGPEGLDCSPRGDKPGFVRVEGERTLILPDRRGNNRIDSLRNIVRRSALPHLARRAAHAEHRRRNRSPSTATRT